MLLIYYFTLFLDDLLLRRIPRHWWYAHGSWLRTILWTVKIFVHWLSGKSEIARILTDPTLGRVKQCLLVKVALKYSRVIKRDDEAVSIAKAKGVRLDMLQPVLTKLQALDAAKLEVEAECAQPVESLFDLQALYQRLMPNSTAAPSSLNDAKWSDLGFQGNNPLTDFRAMGLFGLKQLMAWSRLPTAPTQHQEATYGPHWYGTALVSIHISNWLVNRMRKDELDGRMLQGGIVALNEMHAEIFDKFHTLWLGAEPSSIMEFPHLWKQLESNLLYD